MPDQPAPGVTGIGNPPTRRWPPAPTPSLPIPPHLSLHGRGWILLGSWFHLVASVGFGKIMDLGKKKKNGKLISKDLVKTLICLPSFPIYRQKTKNHQKVFQEIFLCHSGTISIFHEKKGAFRPCNRATAITPPPIQGLRNASPAAALRGAALAFHWPPRPVRQWPSPKQRQDAQMRPADTMRVICNGLPR